MYRNLAGLAAGAIIAIASASAASATPSASAMREGGYALAPFSFVKFCLDYPGDCPKSAGPSRIHLTSAHMGELASVNRAVNAAIRPTPDTSAMRFWRLNVSAGDCNSFAVAKRHELIRRGWPAAALALTVAKTSWGEGHLVVTVRTDQGDLVLDNLRSAIIPWQKTGYDWIMRQSEANPQFWVELDGGQAEPAAAAADFGEAKEVAEAFETNRNADDANEARRPIDGERVLAADAGLKRAGAGRLALVESAKADAPTPPLRQAIAQAAAAAAIRLAQADAPRSLDVTSLEADAATVALAQASRLATTVVDLGYARAEAPRSPDVISLEADAASATLAALKLQAKQASQAAEPSMAALARWIADTRLIAAPILDGLVAAVDRWFAASATTAAKPASDEAREAAAAAPADLTLGGFI
jgi:predicted transglutaminase-like cysteine proteinase